MEEKAMGFRDFYDAKSSESDDEDSEEDMSED